MLAGVLIGVVLVAALLARRAGVVSSEAASPWRERPARWALIAGAVFSFATSIPIWRLAPWVAGNPTAFWADDASHAWVAAEIVAHRLPNGWIDRYFTGFPVGHHYPIGAWTVLSTLIAVGASPRGAASIMGWAGVALVPLSFYVIAVRAGSRPSSAAAGAAFIAWVSPFNSFVGGFEVYYQLGLLSQVAGLHAAMAMMGAAVAGRSRWGAPVAAVFAMLCHPQLGVAAGFLVGVAVLASANRAALAKGARTLVALLCAGAALYGQGAVQMRVPIGWPPGLGWKHVGFSPHQLHSWLLGGQLFDRWRSDGFLTAVAAAALVVTLLLVKRPVPRAAAVTALVALPFSVSGPMISSMGALGQALLSVMQPMRFIALLPVCAAALIVVALEESAPAFAAIVRSRSVRRTRWSVAPAIIAVAFLVPAIRERFNWARNPAQRLATLPMRPCGDQTPKGYDSRAMRAELGALTGGFLWYNGGKSTSTFACAVLDELDGSASVPVAYTGAVGSHVGFMRLAMSRLEPALECSAARAEALGVRYLLLNEVDRVASGWRLRARVGALRLYENIKAVDRVGVGCIRETWTGSNRELEAKLTREFETPEGAARILDPVRLTALVPTSGPWASALAPSDGCSPRGASVVVHPREPGAIAATVDLVAPADIVFRATAFPSWRVTIDGTTAQPRIVAPGLFSVRACQGRHEVLAVAGTLPGYWLALALGALGVAAVSTPSGFIKRLVSVPSGFIKRLVRRR